MGSCGSDAKRRKMRRQLRMKEDVCWLCLLPLNDAAPPNTDWATEIDEVVPRHLGGNPLDITNCHLSHRFCNNHRPYTDDDTGLVRTLALKRMGHNARPKPQPSREW